MEESKAFLKEYISQLQQSPTADEIFQFQPKIVGNYRLNPEDVSNQVIDWVFYYLENKPCSRKCPYPLSVTVAKTVAGEITSEISRGLQENNEDPGKLFNSISLHTTTVSKLTETLTSMLNAMDDHEMNESSHSCRLPYMASVYAIKNKRRKMEDRHVIHHDLNMLLGLKDAPAYSYYAVFDGHAGVDAASYASAHLHVNIANHPAFLTDTTTAIAEAIKITDENFLKKCNDENIKSGATAVCALISERTLHLAWLGDSQAVLVKSGKPAIVTSPHKPDREDEQKRIKDLGGEISFHTGIARVNGILAVTRAIGDPDHKHFICGDAEITTLNLDGSEDFLVLACDGLWDGMSPEDVTSALYRNVAEGDLNMPIDHVAAKLVHQSKLLGSDDNISVVVVFLRDLPTIKEYAEELVAQGASHALFMDMNGQSKEDSRHEKPSFLDLDPMCSTGLDSVMDGSTFGDISGITYSAEIPDPYSFSYVNSNPHDPILIPHRRAAHLGPEATALSELPTPPIDDVLASQQFEQMLHTTSMETSETETHSEVQNLSFVVEKPTAPQANDSVDLQGLENDITPDEALGLANNVVCDTIENAIKCISTDEEDKSPVSTQKLNPYAEPFVMKAFVPEASLADPNLFSETSLNGINTQYNQMHIGGGDFQYSMSTNSASGNTALSSEAVDSKAATSTYVCNEEIAVDTKYASNADIIHSERNTSQFTTFESSVGNGSLHAEKVLSAHLESDSKVDFYTEHETAQSTISRNVSDYMAENQNIVAEKNIEFTGEENLMNITSGCLLNDSGILTEIDQVAKCELAASEEFMANGKEYESKSSEYVEENLAAGISKLAVADNNELISTANIVGQDVLDFTCRTEVKDLNVEYKCEENHGKHDMFSNDFTSDLSRVELSEGQFIQSTPLKLHNIEPQNGISNIGSIEHDDNLQANLGTTIDHANMDEITSRMEAQNCISNVVDPGANYLEDLSSNLIADTAMNTGLHNIALMAETSENAILENLLPAAALNLGDNELLAQENIECPVEAVDVDLKSLPEGIPEAEGVTEDVDSDSEKDGGWSYMKVAATKSKDEGKPTKDAKAQNKTDALTKSKETTKSQVDKAKVRQAPAAAKIKSTAPDKKTLDLKEKSKTLKNVSSTIPKVGSEKTSKQTSTTLRVKKELPSSSNKVPSVTAVKPTRPTTLRNVTTASKTSTLPSAERNPTSTISTSSVRPKSTLSTNTMKVTGKSAIATSTIPKTSSTTQSIKSKVMPTTRVATTARTTTTTTVPSKIQTKPPLSSKTTTLESKPKSLTAPKKPVTLAPKRADVKEAKDIANKQISARREVTSGTNRATSAASSAASNKHPATSVASTNKRPATSIAATNKHPATNLATTNKQPAASKQSATLNNKSFPIKSRTPVSKSNLLSKSNVPKPPASKTPSKSSPAPKILKSSTTEKVCDNVVGDVLAAKGAEGVEIIPVCEEKFMLEVNAKENSAKDEQSAAAREDLIENTHNSELDQQLEAMAIGEPLGDQP